MKRTEHTQKWLDALRSGEYQQGTGQLRAADRFCCLGVGGMVAGITDLDESLASYEAIMNRFGMDELEKGMLTRMNDSEHKTFPEIEDAIEQMLDVN